ncbi:hypothetical protein [Georgenia thermotolerans]|uniref:Uncharacterized protein n=1 Tax=Georgenia thermotolerans TaxID=527326 RepID=A0A7J5UKN0_9MICO|nr:hypothetical protein [Georgenia thermotolerans]KAE8762423.1 hypothetical protein GB883_19455 [Georgenia thermotolerans]
MNRRIISVVLMVLGVIAIALAIASATVWRPTDTATLTLPTRPTTPVVISDAGVLDAVAPDVRIVATADDGQPVTLAVGRTEDVQAWVDGAPHTRITGLSSWEQLAVKDVAGGEATEGAAPAEGQAALPSPAGSDLWVSEQTGTGTAELSWKDRDGRWSLLAATDGTAPAPQVSLSWPREVSTPWLVPGLIVGALLLLAGLALAVLEVLTARELRRREAVAGAPEDETVVLPAAETAGLTRRQLRERARAAAQQGRGRRGEPAEEAATAVVPAAAAGETAATEDLVTAGSARGAGIVPASPRAAEYRRERDAADEGGDDGADQTQQMTAVAEGEQAGAGADPTQPMAAVGGETESLAVNEDDLQAAGVARGTGVVPAADSSPELRQARETGPAAGEHEEEEAAGEAGQPPSWRSMWGFGERKETTDDGPEAVRPGGEPQDGRPDAEDIRDEEEQR